MWGGGVKNYQKLHDVIYGRPLTHDPNIQKSYSFDEICFDPHVVIIVISVFSY
jgi:hypothetical protein